MAFFDRYRRRSKRNRNRNRNHPHSTQGWRERPCERKGCPPYELDLEEENTLANIRPGERAMVVGFCERMNPERRAHLQAYGLVPGRAVQVVQQSPVTVVQVDHTELALEVELACGVYVTDPAVKAVNRRN